MTVPKIRSISHTQIGDAPFTINFKKPYLLIVIRVSNRTDLSNFYTEQNMTDYELATANYTNFQYDRGQLNQPEVRQFTAPTLVSDSLPVGTQIKYVITFIEFD